MTHPAFSTDGLSKLIASTGGTFGIFFFFAVFQYIFKVEFVCPCDTFTNIWFCLLYIILPIFIFFLIFIVVDKIFCEILCSCKCCALCKRTARALTVGFLWMITALMDGDWLVCMETTLPNITISTQQTACKKKPTDEDLASIRKWKSYSQVGGLVLLSLVLCIWAIAIYCSRWKKACCSVKYNMSLLDEYEIDEANNNLEKIIRELVKNSAHTSIQVQVEKIKEQCTSGRDDIRIPDTDTTDPGQQPGST